MSETNANIDLDGTDIEQFSTKYIDAAYVATDEMDYENADPGWETPEDGATAAFLVDESETPHGESDGGFTICTDTFHGGYGDNDFEPTEPVDHAETIEEAVEKMDEILNE